MALSSIRRLLTVVIASLLTLPACAMVPHWFGPPPLFGGIAWPAWHGDGRCADEATIIDSGVGSWYWVRSPEQESRHVAGLFNRYCVRCHGCDGRGVWDIPDVPDFTNACWQSSRSDAQLTRLTLEGRGAVMPAFRGTLTLEEAAALARYLRRFAHAPENGSIEEIPVPRRLPHAQPDTGLP
jgi:mono/diheme cytochrome c family protein